jgi:hypothetical protein
VDKLWAVVPIADAKSISLAPTGGSLLHLRYDTPIALRGVAS